MVTIVFRKFERVFLGFLFFFSLLCFCAQFCCLSRSSLAAWFPNEWSSVSPLPTQDLLDRDRRVAFLAVYEVLVGQLDLDEPLPVPLIHNFELQA